MLLPILWLLRSSAHSLDAIFSRKIKTRQKFHIHDTVLIASEVTTLIVWGRHRYKFRNISLSVTLSDWLSDWGDNITGCVTWDMTHRPATDMHRGGGDTSGHPWSLASPHHYIVTSEILNRVQQNTFHTGSTGSSSDFEQRRGISVESNWLIFQLCGANGSIINQRTGSAFFTLSNITKHMQLCVGHAC